jgi:phage nucleotide-binding protein
MSLVFTNTSQAAADHGQKILVYGDAGAGKTVLASTLPNPVILSAESGLLSLRKYSIPVILIRNVDDLMEAYNWASQSAEANNFQSIAIDSITEVGEVVLTNAKRQVKDPRQAYGELIEKMEAAIKAFRDLPNKNIYMSAKMEPMKDEMTGIVTYGPSMPGAKLGPKLPYLFDFVFRLGINKTPDGTSTYRFLQTQPELKYGAKDRSGVLDPMEPPNLSHIINKVMGV